MENIFNSNDKNWLQGFANDYHVKTKEHVILGLLPFEQGDWINQEQIREAERILRAQNYLRDASITISEKGVLTVKVTDTWSLLPTFSFSRAGGQNTSSFGVRDSNLLGLGVATTLKYKKDDQKSGYRLRLNTPTNITSHSNASVVLEDYDVGTQRSFEYSQPFIAQNTPNSFFASVATNELENIYYQNDHELGTVLTKSNQLNTKYGWLERSFNNTVERSYFGLSIYSLGLVDYSDPNLAQLFNIRENSYFWWGKETLENQFQVLKNIYLISNKEDINLGFHQNYQLGLGTIESISKTGNREGSQNFLNPYINKLNMLKLSYSVSEGFIVNDALLLQRFELNTELYDHLVKKTYYNFNYNLDAFYPFDTQFSFYLGNNFSYTSEFRETPHALGGDTGLRGYPLQYQYGKKRWLSKFEARYHSNAEIMKIFSFGLVGFIDVGRAWDNPSFDNIEGATLASIGVGLRLFPKIASGRNVIHIDLARPYSNNNQLDGWEWRVQVKGTF